MTAQWSQLQAECAGHLRARCAFPGGRPQSVLPHTLLRLSLLARRIMNGATVQQQRQHFVLFSHTSQWSEGALTLEMLLGKQGGVVGLEGGGLYLSAVGLTRITLRLCLQWQQHPTRRVLVVTRNGDVVWCWASSSMVALNLQVHLRLRPVQTTFICRSNRNSFGVFPVTHTKTH